MSGISWKALTTVAGLGGMAVGAMALLVNRERDNRANQANFVKTAVNLLRKQPIAAELLGTEDFEVGRATLSDGFGKIDKNQVRVRIPIKGTLDNGSLFVYAKRPDPQGKLKLYKMEMAFDKVVDKKLVLLDRDEGVEDHVEPKEDGEDAVNYKNMDKKMREQKLAEMVMKVDHNKLKSRGSVSFKLEDIEDKDNNTKFTNNNTAPINKQ